MGAVSEPPLLFMRMTSMDNEKYNCKTCPYASYRDGNRVFCSVCMRSIMEQQRAEKKKQNSEGGVISGNHIKDHQSAK